MCVPWWRVDGTLGEVGIRDPRRMEVYGYVKMTYRFKKAHGIAHLTNGIRRSGGLGFMYCVDGCR